MDRVSRIKHVLVGPNAHFEFAAQYGQELDAGMMMRSTAELRAAEAASTSSLRCAS